MMTQRGRAWQSRHSTRVGLKGQPSKCTQRTKLRAWGLEDSALRSTEPPSTSDLHIQCTGFILQEGNSRSLRFADWGLLTRWIGNNRNRFAIIFSLLDFFNKVPSKTTEIHLIGLFLLYQGSAELTHLGKLINFLSGITLLISGSTGNKRP